MYKCPKCGAIVKREDLVSYGRTYSCRNCGAKFDKPLEKFHCLSCGRDFDQSNAIVRKLSVFEVDRNALKKFVNLVVNDVVNEIARSSLSNVSDVVRGSSGIDYRVNVVGSSGGTRIAFVTVGDQDDAAKVRGISQDVKDVKFIAICREGDSSCDKLDQLNVQVLRYRSLAELVDRVRRLMGRGRA